MREANFSIPNVNKAAVGITTALYDRRALDCTSTLPLMNSLHHLAYLTTSSARIRDILTVDGGIERLVCILKEGKTRDMQDMWKWNLALQCAVNIGVRGSENVRTRVVQADMVPVIATILDNYIKIIDKCRERAEADAKRSNSARLGACGKLNWKSGSGVDAPDRSDRYARLLSPSETRSPLSEHRSSRRHPPPIDIPALQQPATHDANAMEVIPSAPQAVLSSPPERTSFSRHHHHHHHHHRHHEHQSRPTGPFPAATRSNGQQPATVLSPDTITDASGLLPVRHAELLPSMPPVLQAEVSVLPETPTTPRGPSQARPSSPRGSVTASRSRSRPSIRHQLSLSGDSDDGQNDGTGVAGATANTREPRVDIMDSLGSDDDVRAEAMLEDTEATIPVALPNASDNLDTAVLRIAGPGGLDGSIMNAIEAPVAVNLGFPPVQPTVNVINAPPTTSALQWYTRLYRERMPSCSLVPSMPRDEDVLLCLQLLAYVSKYCNLRSYFQQSHLVPRLKIGDKIKLIDGESPSAPPTEDELEEYLQPDDFNIFPLVEKFTVRHHSEEMQYWAGVVMRNLCRKDDSRGGIRQCAYYQCGKWEEYTRQFAKCRRCRRTKYCSKECQKSAWVYHRHWCVAATPQ